MRTRVGKELLPLRFQKSGSGHYVGGRRRQGARGGTQARLPKRSILSGTCERGGCHKSSGTFAASPQDCSKIATRS
eukprot:3584972-Amphidinium_carterae.1